MRSDIQALRGLAVIAVVLFHLDSSTIPNGYLGVDVFFIISGYVLSNQILEFGNPAINKLSYFKLFIERRIRRLLPAFIAIVCFTTLISVFVSSITDLRNITSQGISAYLLLSNLQAFKNSQGNYFSPDPNPLLHTWSLSTEEQIYISICIAILIANKTLRQMDRKSIQILMVSILTVVAGLTFLNVIFHWLPQNLIFFMPSFRLLEFGLGFLAAQFFKINSNYQISHIFLFSILIILTISRFENNITYLFTLLITILLVSTNYKSNSKKNIFIDLFKWIGDRSYSIYLIHLPTIYIFHRFSYSHSNLRDIFIIFSLIILLSQYSWKIFEIKGKNLDYNKIGILWLTSLIILMVIRLEVTSLKGLGEYPKLVGTIKCLNSDTKLCIIHRAKSNENVLIVGDSHANALVETLKNSLEAKKKNGYIISGRGCRIQRTYNDFNKSCNNYMKLISNAVNELKPKVMIIAQRSNFGYESISRTEYHSDLETFIKEYSKIVDRMVVITPNPEFFKGSGQPSLIELWKESQTTENPQNLIKISKIDGDIIIRKYSKDQKIRIINSFDLFCSKTLKCFTQENNKILYWDSNHLSIDGAFKYNKVLTEAL